MPKSINFICCDVTSRLSADISLLLKECKIFTKLQRSYHAYEEQQKLLLNELYKNINDLQHKKPEVYPDNTEMVSKINEAKWIILQVWENAKEHFWDKSLKLKYLTKDGLPVTPYIHKLTAFTEHIYSNYYQNFVHPRCCSAFLHLSNQIRNVVYPELSYADTFEQNLAFLMWTVQFLNHLHSIIDLYSSSSILDIVSFYNQLISEERNDTGIRLSNDFLPSMVLCSLLKGDFFEEEEIETSPIVEDHVSKFYEVIFYITKFLIEITSTPNRIEKKSDASYKGCLNASYAKPYPVVNSCSSCRGATTFRGRSRTSRGSYTNRSLGDKSGRLEKTDLTPIRVPSLMNTHLFPIE